jgi:hypothetical protein
MRRDQFLKTASFRAYIRSRRRRRQAIEKWYRLANLRQDWMIAVVYGYGPFARQPAVAEGLSVIQALRRNNNLVHIQ